MKRIASLAVAGLLGTVTTVAASAALSPSSTAAMTRESGFARDALVPSLAVQCLSTTKAAVAMATYRIPGKTYTFETFVNGARTSSGHVQASTTSGLVRMRSGMPNNKINGVALRLNGVQFVSGHVVAHCGSTTTTSSTSTTSTSSLMSASRGSSTAYTLHNNSNGTVTRWNPCDGDIHVRINPTGGGSGALSDAQTALKALAAATGLHFVYDGTTSFIPRSTNSGSQPAPLVIAWGSRSQTDYLGTGAIGEGGWRSSGTSADGVHWTWKITQGFVVVDPTASVAGGFGRGITRGALLMHELGHVVGLGHTSDSLQVMSPVLNSSSYASWGSGDKAGLVQVGATKGCVPTK
jgi:hypothetical protein